MEEYAENYQVEEIDLREVILTIWNEKLLICVITMLVVITAVAVTKFFIEPVYQTEAVIMNSNMSGLSRNLEEINSTFKSDNYLQYLIQKNDNNYTSNRMYRYLENNLELNQMDDNNVFRVKLQHNDQETAYDLLTQLVVKYVAEVENDYKDLIKIEEEYLYNIEESLANTVNNLEKINQQIDELVTFNLSSEEKSILLIELNSRLDNYLNRENTLVDKKRQFELNMARYYPAQILKEPDFPDNPISPNFMLNTAVAFVLGIMLSLFIVFLKVLMSDEKK